MAEKVLLASGSGRAQRNHAGSVKVCWSELRTKRSGVPEETFDFLGYTIGRCYKPQTGRAYIGTRPAKKKIARLCQAISDLTRRTWLHLETDELIGRLNRKLVGWSNYFCLGPVSTAYRAVDSHVRERLRRWLCAQHKVRSRRTKQFPDDYLYGELQLVRLTLRTRRFPWAQA